MPDSIIHRLKPSDILKYRELMSLFSVVFGEPDTYAAAPPSDAYVEQLLGKEHFVALVATEDDAIVGGLAAYELEKFEQERSEFYIYDLAVSVRSRRKGIATALIDCLCRIAADRNAWVVFVQADKGDEPAIALYDKLGMREEVFHFDIAPAKT